LDDTIRQQVHSFARTFLNIDASDKQLRTAKRLKAAAAARLDSQRAYYAEGRITVDRFLDAVSQYATAVATEAQCKATYNTSIVALQEAKGKLLEDYGIVVLERPKPRWAVAARQPKTDGATKLAALVAEPTSKPAPAPPPMAAARPTASGVECGTGCCESNEPAFPAGPTSASRSWTFSFTIGSGPRAVQLKGTISADDPVRPNR
jgi:Outer membrane efflux protein